MGRRIKVTAIKKEEPNLHLYVLALIALARQLQEQDGLPVGGDATDAPSSEEASHERD